MDEGTIFLFKKRFYLFNVREGEGREKRRERNIDVGEKHPSVASCTRPTGDWPANQASALTGN